MKRILADDRTPAGDASLSEEGLVAGLIAGSRAVIAEFLSRTHHPVYYMACRLTRDVEARGDWTHEVLLAILDDLRRGRFVYTRPGSFWAWFRKRAYYRLLDEYRRQRRRWEREQTGTGAGSALDLEALGGGRDPNLELERVEIRAAIETCLERLASEHHRRALWLLLVEQLDYQTIAERMSAPLNTVRAWIRRGRIAVRRCLVRALDLDAEVADV